MQYRNFSSRNKLAGQSAAGRKVSSTNLPDPQVFDTIDFIIEALWKDKDFLLQKYVLEGLSIAQIAAQILSSRETVRMGLVEHKIKRTPQGKPQKKPAQIPYGYRLSDGVIVPHLGEQRVVSSIRKMSDDGLSYRKICEFLTSVGVPTKNRGQSWHPEMIRRILTRNTQAQSIANITCYSENDTPSGMKLLFAYLSNPIEYWPQLLLLIGMVAVGVFLIRKIQSKKLN